MQKTIVKISGDSYLNLHNIYDVVYEMGVGDFKIIELINTIEKLFPDFSELQKMDLGLKTIKVLKALN